MARGAAGRASRSMRVAWNHLPLSALEIKRGVYAGSRGWILTGFGIWQHRVNQINLGTMLPALRAQTSDAHAALDASFGSLSLDQRADYVRFLKAHAAGLAPLFDIYLDFVTRELAVPCPDFMGMLAEDLTGLGEDTAQLPRLSVPCDLDAAGVAYVVTGSRLGLTMIRRGGYWGRENGLPSRYMEDDTGLLVWKALLPWMKNRSTSPAEEASAARAALAAFDTFGAAFAANAPACVH